MKLFWISFIGIVLQMNHNLGLADGGDMQNYILGMSGLLIALTLLSIYLKKSTRKSAFFMFNTIPIQ